MSQCNIGRARRTRIKCALTDAVSKNLRYLRRRIMRRALALAALLWAFHSFGANHPPITTFTKDIAPILRKNCQGCHRPGEAAPFSLLTYEDARPWAKAMRSEERRVGKECRSRWSPYH